MKKLYLLVVSSILMMSATLVSCSKDENDIVSGGNGPLVDEEFLVHEVFNDEIDDTFEALASLLKISSEGDNGSESPEAATLQLLKADYINSVAEKSDNMNGAGNNISNTHIAKNSVSYTITLKNGEVLNMTDYIYVPYDNEKKKFERIKGFLVNMYGTRPQGDMGNEMAAAYSAKLRAARGWVVIEPSYIGFGAASGRLQNYLCQREIAEYSMNLILAAIKKVKNSELIGGYLDKDYKTLITGYSQGGGNAMALARHITLNCTQEEKDLLHYTHTLCGDGPYDPYATFSQWISQDWMTISALFPMVLYGLNVEHSDLFAGSDLQTYFTQAYWNSGIPTLIINMTGGMTECTAWDEKEAIPGAPESLMGARVSPTKIVSPDVLDINSDKHRRLKEALQRETVCYDWTPNVPITILGDFHDDVVPYVNTQIAYETLMAKAPDMVNTIMFDSGSHMITMTSFLVEVSFLLDKYDTK